LQALAQGLAYKQIADQLNVSIHTVRNYIRRVYEKLHVRSRTEAVVKFFKI
jgi:DNA-binding NarL/FixJ family response regulator